jgi:hypothetical protein
MLHKSDGAEKQTFIAVYVHNSLHENKDWLTPEFIKLIASPLIFTLADFLPASILP